MYDDLYTSLRAIVTFFNRPKQDKYMLREAGISLDTALFPLLMRIAHYGELGIVELADQVDRDHSTVSRQIDRLIAMGFATEITQTVDRRVRKVGLTGTGSAIASTIAATRRTLMHKALLEWSDAEKDTLRQSLEHLADTLQRSTVA